MEHQEPVQSASNRLPDDARQSRRQSSRLRSLPNPKATENGSGASTSHLADGIALGKKIRTLAHRSNLIQAELIEAIGHFEAMEGWRLSGAKDCVAWIQAELGDCRSLAYEKLRIARTLRSLPTLAQHFSNGDLGFAKIRAVTRVANSDNEDALTAIALANDAETVIRRCDEYRWGKEGDRALDDGERDRQRFLRRSLTTSLAPDGSTILRIVLPPEMGANVLRCLEHHLDLDMRDAAAASRDAASPAHSAIARPTAAQRRADAVVTMAEASLSGGSDVSSADRNQVIAIIDAEALEVAARDLAKESPDSNKLLPMPVRASIAGIAGGSISPSTARRLACDGTLVSMIVKQGEPIAVGRKQRSLPPPTRRAVIARDGACTFPGCGSTRHLDVHHVSEWRFGGTTSVAGSTTLCRRCHTRVHDEGWIIEPVTEGGAQVQSDASQALLNQASERTRDIVRTMEERLPRFRFLRPQVASGKDAACCRETAAKYRVGRMTTRKEHERILSIAVDSHPRDGRWRPAAHRATSRPRVTDGTADVSRVSRDSGRSVLENGVSGEPRKARSGAPAGTELHRECSPCR